MSEGPPEKWQKGIVQQENNPAQLGQKIDQICNP